MRKGEGKKEGIISFMDSQLYDSQGWKSWESGKGTSGAGYVQIHSLKYSQRININLSQMKYIIDLIWLFFNRYLVLKCYRILKWKLYLKDNLSLLQKNVFILNFIIYELDMLGVRKILKCQNNYS